MSKQSNVAEPLPLRRDLMKTYRNAALLGWIVAAVLFVVSIALAIFIALKPAPLAGIDKDGFVVGQVVFDEPRLRDSNAVLADMKNFVRRCLTSSKQTVWEDITICMNHLESDLADKRMEAFEESGELLRIESYGCDRVEFNFDAAKTGITKHERMDYMAEGLLEGTAACNDSGNADFRKFKIKLTALLVPKTENVQLGIKVYDYEDL